MNTVNRRTMLRASGVALALPLLESMTPALGKESAPPRRMVFVCTTLGLHPPALWPKTSGRDYEATEYLSLLADHRDDFTLFSGLSHESQAGRQPHNCEITWLTSARGPGLDGFRNSISVDQYAASRLGYVTRFPSITLGSNSPQSQSYTSNGVMIPAETSPAKLFAKLFLQGKRSEIEQQKQKLNDGQSTLDQLRNQRQRLRRKVSAGDSRQLDEYFEAVRKAEQEISEAKDWLDKPKPVVDAQRPQDLHDPTELIGRTQRLLNMIPLIVQTDSTRVVSVLIQDHGVSPKINGVSGTHHNLSHHGQDSGKIDQLKKIEAGLVSCFGSLLSQMKETAELDGRLIDNSSILFGSNLGNANSHDTRNLPIFLAGGGYEHGQFVPLGNDGDQPLCNLFVRMLNNAGLQTDSFGQSTGELAWPDVG